MKYPLYIHAARLNIYLTTLWIVWSAILEVTSLLFIPWVLVVAGIYLFADWVYQKSVEVEDSNVQQQ